MTFIIQTIISKCPKIEYLSLDLDFKLENNSGKYLIETINNLKNLSGL